jgi:hypothetical protein
MRSRLLLIVFGMLLFSLAPERAEAQDCLAGYCCTSPNCVNCVTYWDMGCGCNRRVCEATFGGGRCGCTYSGGQDCDSAVGFCYWVNCCPGRPAVAGACTSWPWEPPRNPWRSTRVARKLPREGTLLSGT